MKRSCEGQKVYKSANFVHDLATLFATPCRWAVVFWFFYAPDNHELSPKICFSACSSVLEFRPTVLAFTPRDFVKNEKLPFHCERIWAMSKKTHTNIGKICKQVDLNLHFYSMSHVATVTKGTIAGCTPDSISCDWLINLLMIRT